MVPRLLSEAEVVASLRGARVAVVGNAASVLEQRYGAAIESADVVVRLNAGVPGPEHAQAIGMRTDILSVGNLKVLHEALYQMCGRPVGPSQVWFLKPTKMGAREWHALRRAVERGENWTAGANVWRFPNEYIKHLALQIGAPPSGGACVLSFVLSCAPEKVDAYGFDWFQGSSWWHSARPGARVIKSGPTHDHDGAKERAYFYRLEGMVGDFHG